MAIASLTKGSPALRWIRLAIGLVIFAAAVWVALQEQAGNGVSVVCGSSLDVPAADEARLRAFAERLELRYPDAFARVASHVNNRGRLPECYVTKREAREAGWRPGERLWDSVPGGAIGGDRFGNRERRLPARYDGAYVEADLDYDGARRGARRLVFARSPSGRWLQWVTVDHYETFHPVPKP